MTSTPSAHTGQLVARAARGETGAFGELVDPVAMRLLLFIRSRGRHLLGSDCDAEDVLQAVLLTAWKKLDSFEFRGGNSFYSWLVAIARGTLGDRIKYLRAKGRGAVKPLESRAAEDAFDPRTSINKLMARKEDYERACNALEDLPPAEREVVELHLLEGSSMSEIATALGISKSTVWARLHKGIDGLRLTLGGTPI